MDTQVKYSLESAIAQDRQIFQAVEAARVAAEEQQRDTLPLDVYQAQVIVALGLVITVLASAITA